MSLANQPARTYSKSQQLNSKRVKLTQKQMGDISPNVRIEVRERSQEICEVKKRCNGSRAMEMAHITGRKQLKHKTTAADILDSCIECHRWMDDTVEGIRYRKSLV